MAVPLVIQCGDHRYAPYSLVCIHLRDGQSNDWCPVEVTDSREVESDWVCESCRDLHRQNIDITNHLQIVCINCLREMWESLEINPLSQS